LADMARPAKKPKAEATPALPSLLPSVPLPGGLEARRYKPQGELKVEAVKAGEPTVNLRVLLPKSEWMSLHLWALSKGVSETEAIRYCLKRVVPTLEVFLVGKDPEAPELPTPIPVVPAPQPVAQVEPAPSPSMQEEDPLVTHRRQVQAEMQAKTVEVRNALKLTPAPEMKEEVQAPSPEQAPAPQVKEELKAEAGWGMVDRIQTGPTDEKAVA
jgi:hypothetical protein